MKKPPFKETPRIEWKNGAWRYRPKKHELPEFDNKTWYRIGVNEHEVYEFLANRARFQQSRITAIGRGLDRYLVEVVPLKAFKTQESNRTSITRIRKVLGLHAPGELEFSDFIEYRNAVAETSGKQAANSDLEVLSHLYTKLIEWGVLHNRDHPLRGLKYKYPATPRDRYTEHVEVTELHQHAGPFLKIWIPFKLKTSLDQITIVNIKLSEVTEEGIYYRRGKLDRYDSSPKSKLKVILWDEELKLLVGRMVELRGLHEYLFCNDRGGQYVDKNGTASPVRRTWARLRKKMANMGKPLTYTEHDLRAKSLSDETELSVAIQRGDHSQGSTTSRVYRRKAEPTLSLHLGAAGLEELLRPELCDAHVAEYYWYQAVSQSG